MLAAAGIVLNRLLKVGGITLDHAVAQLVRYSHDFLIGRITAEMLRKRFGVFSEDNKRLHEGRGPGSDHRGAPAARDLHQSCAGGGEGAS